jgi:hypothetical protein
MSCKFYHPGVHFVGFCAYFPEEHFKSQTPQLIPNMKKLLFKFVYETNIKYGMM